MKKNILFIIESSETGGAESVFYDLVTRVDQSLYTPHVALLYNGWLFDKFMHSTVRPHIISPGSGRFDYPLLAGLYRLAKTLDIDLIHSHLFTTNVYSSLVGVLLHIPVIATFHGTMDVSVHDRFAWLKWRTLNVCAREIVFVSTYLKNYFVAGNLAKASKARVIYNGIDIGKFKSDSDTRCATRQDIGVDKDGFVVAAIGDLRPAKDYETAIQAIAVLKDKIPGLVLIVAGTMTDLHPRLEVLCKKLNVSEHVKFLGFRADVIDILKASDLYLTTSTSEGFSLTLVEAMSSEIPVIATRCGGPEEIVSPGKTGILVEKGNYEEIASSIEHVYSNRDEAHMLAENAASDVRHRFSVTRMVGEYQSLYQDTLFKY